MKEISNIEQEHKKQRGLHQETYQMLINKREELKRLMDQETKEKFFQIAKERYQWGDKAGKHLARIFRKKKTRHFIGKIQSTQGSMVYETKEIGEIF